MSARASRITFLSLGVLILGAILVAQLIADTGQSSEESTEQKTTSLDPILAQQVDNIRSLCGLSNENLAAAGCTQAQAESLFGGIKDWTETNKDQLTAYQNSQAKVQAEISELVGRINKGPKADSFFSQLKTLRGKLSQIRQQYELFIENGIGQIAGSFLSSGQIQQLTAVRQNERLGIKGIERFVAGVTTEKVRVSHRESLAKLRNARSPQKDEYGRVVAADSSYSTSSVAINSSDLGAVRNQISQNMQGVLQASDKILPAPVIDPAANLSDAEMSRIMREVDALRREQQ